MKFVILAGGTVYNAFLAGTAYPDWRPDPILRWDAAWWGYLTTAILTALILVAICLSSSAASREQDGQTR